MAPNKKTATKLTVEKKATVISKATHEKVVAEKDALIKEKKSEITTAKKDALDWEQRALAAEKKVAELGNEIGTKEKQIVRNNRWVLWAIPMLLLVATVVAMSIHIHKEPERQNKAVNAYKAYVQDSLKRVDYKKTDDAVENSGKVISGIPHVNPADVKKN